MTVGQRIAQRRKELGLSQEALGERLGVSRQAIYKWESDAALPEIEKLVNLSREFSVSIDWLLGQEDETREPQELTPEQLRMVEEIVGRYLAAQPGQGQEPAPRPEPAAVPALKRRRWPWALAALVLAGVFWSLFGRLEQMKRDYHSLQSSIEFVNQSVNQQINGITSRVEDVLQSQNSLTAEQSAEVTATDYRANTVSISARAVPRTYVEGMAVEFIVASAGETITVPGEPGDGLAFAGSADVPLSDEITVSVALVTGEQRETQVIDQFYGLYESSFPYVDITDTAVANEGDGWIASRTVDIILFDQQGESTDGVEVKLGLFRDRKLVQWYAPVEEADRVDGWKRFALEETIPLDLNVPYCLAALVADEYGRTRIYTNGEMICNDQSTAQSVSETYSSDPADWGL